MKNIVPLLPLFLSLFSWADTITATLSGEVSGFNDVDVAATTGDLDYLFLPGGISIGDEVLVTLTYDSAAPDQNSVIPGREEYSLLSLQVEIEGQSWTVLNPAPVDGSIITRNQGTGDQFFAFAGQNMSVFEGTVRETVNFDLTDGSSPFTFLSNEFLPLSTGDVDSSAITSAIGLVSTEFTPNSNGVNDGFGSDEWQIFYTLDAPSFAIIPEPSPYLLVGLFLLLFFLKSCRRRM